MKDVIPLNTGKVRIGLTYIPKPSYEPDFDALLFQNAFLQKYNPVKFFTTKSSPRWFK